MYSLSLSLSLSQTRSSPLAARLKKSTESSMKADASLQPGAWRAYRAAAPSTRFLYLMAWITTPMSTTSTLTVAPRPATRPTCSAPPRAARATSTTATRRAAPSTLTAWWCPPSWCPRPPRLTTSPAAPSPECTTARSTTTQPPGTTALPSQPQPPPRPLRRRRRRLLPPRTSPASRATAYQPTSSTSTRSSCRCTATASTHCSTSAPPPRRSSAARAPAASDTWFTPSRSSSQSPIPLRARPRWTAQRVTWSEAEEEEQGITITANTPLSTAARGARAKSASTARADGGAQTTTWTATAPTAHPASCPATTGNTPATAIPIPCTATTSETSRSKPLRVATTSSAQPARLWGPKASSWRGAPGPRWLSARPRRLTEGQLSIWINPWCTQTSSHRGRVTTCR